MACLVGMLLGASKVLFTLLWFKVFGAINYLDSFPVFITSWASAQLIGPILGWWSLSGHGAITDPTYRSSLGDAVAIYCYASAGAQAAAFLTSFLITNIDFTKYQHFQKQSSNSTDDVEEEINGDLNKRSVDDTQASLPQDELEASLEKSFADAEEVVVAHE